VPALAQPGPRKFANITESAGVGMEGKVCAGAAFADVGQRRLPDLFVTTVKLGTCSFTIWGRASSRMLRRKQGWITRAIPRAWFSLTLTTTVLLDLYVANIGIYTSAETNADGSYVGLRDAFYGHLHPERTEHRHPVQETWAA